MGGIRRHRKKILTPGHPYDKERLASELVYVGEYGLRNKKELWKARTILSRAREQARKLLAQPEETRKQREQELISRLNRLGFLPRGSDLDAVLALDIRTVLDRRLQTIVYSKGLAMTPYQARQFVVHRHISIKDQVVTSPGRLITVEEEDYIDYSPNSPLRNEDHPARPRVPTVADEEAKGRARSRRKKNQVEEEDDDEEDEVETEVEDDLDA